MKSFGLWYKRSDDNEEKNIEVKPKASLHVNFWSCEDLLGTKNAINPYLDIGIKIENYKLIEELCFHCPFPLSKDDNIKDLTGKLEKKSNACLIFNEDCEVETRDSYTIIKIENEKENEELLLFSLDQVVKDVCEVQKSEAEEETNILFKFKDFIEYIDHINRLKELDKIYIRFRIKDVSLNDYLFFDSEPLNKSFESAFSGTRIIDFKINEKRNINEMEKAAIVVGKREWLNIKKVHFLVMIPSSYDLESLSSYDLNCRELEEHVWDDYLGDEIDTNKGHVLAYHWKTVEESQVFSCLVKIKYYKARISTILSYIFMVISLGIVSSVIVTGISNDEKRNGLFILWSIVIAVLIFAIGIGISFINNDKKNK